jgi:hypothetical protein
LLTFGRSHQSFLIFGFDAKFSPVIFSLQWERYFENSMAARELMRQLLAPPTSQQQSEDTWQCNK